MTDWPAWILQAAVRRMPAERNEWGAAMRAELAHIEHPHQRWQFAWNCAHVALFPPRREGAIMDEARKHWRTACGVAALFSLLLVTAGAIVERLDLPEFASRETQPPFIVHFLRNWFIATLTFIPIMGGLRTGQPMSKKQWLVTLGTAVLFGVLLVAPFAVMEYWNNPRIRSGEFELPLSLFYGLWLAPTAIFLIAAPIVRRVGAGGGILKHPIALVLRVGFLAFVTIGWVGLLRDQMACFLGGVPGCD